MKISTKSTGTEWRTRGNGGSENGTKRVKGRPGPFACGGCHMRKTPRSFVYVSWKTPSYDPHPRPTTATLLETRLDVPLLLILITTLHCVFALSYNPDPHFGTLTIMQSNNAANNPPPPPYPGLQHAASADLGANVDYDLSPMTQAENRPRLPEEKRNPYLQSRKCKRIVPITMKLISSPRRCDAC
jgi:hypothetical protein